MRTIQSEKDIRKARFGEQLNMNAFPAYYSDHGTDNGEKWGMEVYWTTRRDGSSILEEQTIFGQNGPEIIAVIVHDQGVSGDYGSLDMWLKGVEGQRAA